MLEKIQLELKLDFAFISFPYKLNCLYFCCYFFFWINEHIFLYCFLFKYFVCEDLKRNKL